MFEEAKAAKMKRGSLSGKKKEKPSGGAAKAKKEKDPIEIIDRINAPSKQRKSFGSDSDNKLRGNEDDVILRLDAEKKMKRMREELEEKHKDEMDALKQEFEEKKQRMRRQADDDLAELERQHRSMKSNQEYTIKKDVQSAIDS
jgi:hypothetical protein